jgi:hypothetical protein
MADLPPNAGVAKLARSMPLDQQFFGREAGRRIPARQFRRPERDIELPDPRRKPPTKGSRRHATATRSVMARRGR